MVVFVCFVKEWLGPDLVAIGALVVLLISGILDADGVQKTFGNSAPIIIACMFIISAALERTGAIDNLGTWFEKAAGKSEIRILIVLALVVTPLSAFVNNTPVVVVFLPIVLAICRRHDLKASRLLIPLSYLAIVGGTCTIIGTSTNVVASGYAAGVGMKPFSLLEIAPLGLVFVLITTIYIIFIGRKLLPDRVTLSTLFEAEEGREFLTEAIVSSDSPLVGVSFPDTRLAKMKEIRVIDIMRHGRRLSQGLDKVILEEGDLILFKSQLSGVLDVAESKGVEIPTRMDLGLEGVRTESSVLMEGIVGPNSHFAGKTLRGLNFRQKYGVIVLALHRRGKNLSKNFQEEPIEFGDTLLVEGPSDGMQRLFDEKGFVNLSKPKQTGFRRSKAVYALVALALFVILGAATSLTTTSIALLAAFVVLAFRCIDTREAYQAVDWKVIFMIVGMLGLGHAISVTEIDWLLANQAHQLFGAYGNYVMLAVIYLIAAILTEMISNTAVAALLTPIAMGIAAQLGVDPRPFVVAVMFGSSASFSTPIGYQTNTYVYGAGGYKFTDFCRAGIPLAVVLWIVASFLIPMIWPFKEIEEVKVAEMSTNTITINK